ncbi:MAG: exopolysaccharide biosynthesis polyprenyl glycosylphosphotransferase [Candidatus Nanopelagicales bacterium]
MISSPSRRVQASTGRQTVALMAFDTVVLVTAVWLVHPPMAGTVLGALMLLIVIRWRLGLYRMRFSLSSLDELPRATEAGLVSAGICAVMGFTELLEITVDDIAWVVFVGVGLGLLRAPVYALLRLLRRKGVARKRLLLVGSGIVADAIAEMAEGNLDYGLDLAARIPDLTDIDLPLTAEQSKASSVLIAFSRASEAREVFEIRRGLAVGLTILAVPRYFDLIGENNVDEEVFGVPVLRLGVDRPTFGLALKRGIDVALSTVGLLVFSPLMLVAGLLCKRETGGSMLFRQTRIGKGGRAFELLKLRTMKPVPEATSDTTWNGDGQPIGPVGSFLRRTSIDELPQLWNILRGDMSFVGPRPERPFFFEQFADQYSHYQDRLRMAAGLTGLAQIHDLRGDTSIDDRARFDNRYGDNWNLWSDIKIMLKTVPKVLKGNGE